MVVDTLEKLEFYVGLNPLFADVVEFIKNNEEKVDHYEDLIGSFLMKLTTTHHLSEADKGRSSRMLQSVGEFERIADHASYMANSSEEIMRKKIEFSADANVEVRKLIMAVKEVYSMTIECYQTENTELCKKIGPLRIVIRCVIHLRLIT